VTLFASGDSQTKARLVPICERALRLDSNSVDQLAPHLVMLEGVFRTAHRFDIVHFHIDYLHFPFSRRQNIRHVTTLHGKLTIPELPRLYDEYPGMPVVSISNAQRRPIPDADWQATVYHGLPMTPMPVRSRPGGYLAFLGRISPEKRVDRAIEIARRSGMKLRVAAKVDRADKDYFRSEIEPLLKDPLVEYIGEIDEAAKGDFLGNAHALLFPIDWPEPFGLVMIEAMRCGTPVVAWDCGSVPEVIDEGISGFVVDNLDDAVRAVKWAGQLDRRRCRAVFETRFSAERMARDYLAVYKKLILQAQRRGRQESGDSRRPLSVG
jgi:glycosyltransferase involved in cell wall biosynthesis